MATAALLRKLALALDGTTAAPHFDRTAFKVKRNFVTLAGDGLTANFKFTPDEQALKCEIHPRAFSQVTNAWGQQGWTQCILAEITEKDLAAALKMAWRHALPTPKKKRA